MCALPRGQWRRKGGHEGPGAQGNQTGRQGVDRTYHEGRTDQQSAAQQSYFRTKCGTSPSDCRVREDSEIGSGGDNMVRSTGQEVSDAHGKALALNLDTSIYGTLAEIGAGQEVARWFLRVGAASGTVAKTISAYDKVVSDDIYGAGTRYVSKERLLAMLDFEYGLVLKRLTPTRGENTRFFVFADTVAARNYAGTNDQHGWLGIRFQHEPRAPESQLLLHINLHDSTAELQQQAIG